MPLGVVGIIYESRPNVTADAFGLCFKTSNVVILKGGVQKVVVIARGLLSVATGKEGYFDYGGCLYPQGLVGDQILYFNHRDIVKVVFSGFHDDDDKMMVDNINQWYMESPYERTDVEKLVRERGAQDGGKLG